MVGSLPRLCIYSRRFLRFWEQRVRLTSSSSVRRVGTLSDMPPKTIRFPDDVAEWIAAQAVKLDRSFSWVVVDAMRRQRGAPEKREASYAEVHGPVVSPGVRGPSPDLGLVCPKATCNYSGPRDRCPTHQLPLKPRRR